MGNSVSEFIKKNPCSCAEDNHKQKISEEILNPVTISPSIDMASIVGSKLYPPEDLVRNSTGSNQKTKIKGKINEASMAAKKKAESNPQKALKLKKFYQSKLVEINQKDKSAKPTQMILTGSVADTRYGSGFATVGNSSTNLVGNRGGSSSMIQSSLDGGSSMRILQNKLNWNVLSAKQMQSPELTAVAHNSNKSLLTTTQVIENYRKQTTQGKSPQPPRKKLETVFSTEYEEGLSNSQIIDPSPANQVEAENPAVAVRRYEIPIDAVTAADETPSQLSRAGLTTSNNTGFQAYARLKGVGLVLSSAKHNKKSMGLLWLMTCRGAGSEGVILS